MLIIARLLVPLSYFFNCCGCLNVSGPADSALTSSFENGRSSLSPQEASQISQLNESLFYSGLTGLLCLAVALGLTVVVALRRSLREQIPPRDWRAVSGVAVAAIPSALMSFAEVGTPF